MQNYQEDAVSKIVNEELRKQDEYWLNKDFGPPLSVEQLPSRRSGKHIMLSATPLDQSTDYIGFLCKFCDK